MPADLCMSGTSAYPAMADGIRWPLRGAIFQILYRSNPGAQHEPSNTYKSGIKLPPE